MKENGKPKGRKKTKRAETAGPLHVAFVLDESGSMGHLREAVVAGFDDYVEELRRDGGETLFGLTLFDTERRHVHVARPLAEIPSLRATGYRPGGTTALFDAVAHTVLETDRRLAAEGRADERVMVVVMTDGLENSSTDYDARTIAELIRAYDARPNWTFVYLGAAHEDVEAARDLAVGMAFERGNAMRWAADAASARKAMRSLAGATNAQRRSRTLKSTQVFADACQSEADYRADEPDRP